MTHPTLPSPRPLTGQHAATSPLRTAATFGLALVLAALAGCASTNGSPTSAHAGGSSVASRTPERSTLRELPSMSLATGRLKEPIAPQVVIDTPVSFEALGTDPNPPLIDHGKVAGTPLDPLRPDTPVNFNDASAHADLWSRVRKGFVLPPLESDLVAQHERWYSTRPDYVQRMTERGGRYLFHVVEEVEKRRMPLELALLPFIESAFNPQALSSARASGIWQFMPATGKDFELTQNLFRDDRRDVLASTRAALDYLTRLHRQFGDWHLALAAYNWGEGNVQRAINKNLKAGLPTDYLSLNMPPETRHYVPKLHAVRNIVARPQAFGVTLAPIENHPYFISVPIERDIDVELAARLAQLTVAEFKNLNPSMNKPVILAAGTPQILLPYENAGKFIDNLSRHKGSTATWTAWVVPATMRPAEAARKVGTSEQQLRSVNMIPDRMLVKAGSTLLVPRTAQRSNDVSEAVADNAMMALAPDLPPMKRITIKARKGDTVTSVARRYKVGAAQVAQWNKTSVNDRFARNETVVLFVPQKSGRRAVAASNPRSNGKATAGRSVTPTKVASRPSRAVRPANAPAARNGKVRVAAAR